MTCFLQQILLAEVCHELLWESAIEAYDDAERASRKKELPPEDLNVVVAAMDHGPPDRVLIQKYQVDITRRTLQCLKPLQWLNDEVIDLIIVYEEIVSIVKSHTLCVRCRLSTFTCSC